MLISVLDLGVHLSRFQHGKVYAGEHWITLKSCTCDIVHQIPEFIEFEDRLENSLQRDIVKLEHVRMRLTHEPLSTDLIDMELIELKFIFDRCMFCDFWDR